MPWTDTTWLRKALGSKVVGNTVAYNHPSPVLLYNLFRLVDPGNKRLPLKHLYATLPIGKRPNLSRVQKAGVENEKISMMTSCNFGDIFCEIGQCSWYYFLNLETGEYCNHWKTKYTITRGYSLYNIYILKNIYVYTCKSKWISTCTCTNNHYFTICKKKIINIYIYIFIIIGKYVHLLDLFSGNAWVNIPFV